MITPLDIRKLEFNQKLRGFDKEEVRSALDTIAEELEKQVRENKILSEKLNITEERLNHFKLIEKTLQDSVITMQNTLEEKKKGAEHEAELIIQEAKMKANDETEDYINQVKTLKTEIQLLERQKMNYFIRFKSFLSSQLDWLAAMETSKDDYGSDFSGGEPPSPGPQAEPGARDSFKPQSIQAETYHMGSPRAYNPPS